MDDISSRGVIVVLGRGVASRSWLRLPQPTRRFSEIAVGDLALEATSSRALCLLWKRIAYLEALHRPAGEGNMQELDLGGHLTSGSCHSDLRTRKGTNKKEAIRTLLEAHLFGRPATGDRGHLHRHPKRILAEESKERHGRPSSKNEKKNENPPIDFDLHDDSLPCHHCSAPAAESLLLHLPLDAQNRCK